MTPPLHLCPLHDSAEATAAEERISKARYFRADELITSAAEAARQGFYHGPNDRTVSLEAQIQAAFARLQRFRFHRHQSKAELGVAARFEMTTILKTPGKVRKQYQQFDMQASEVACPRSLNQLL
jgi:hypothetical protein